MSVKEANSFMAEECEIAASASLDIQSNRQERDIENFLNDVGIRNIAVKDIELESGSVTVNEDMRSSSVMSLKYDSANEYDMDKHSTCVSVNMGPESLPIVCVNMNGIESPLVDSIAKTTDNGDRISYPENIVPNTIECVTTRTHSDREISEHNSIGINENNIDKDMSSKKSPEYQMFTDELIKLFATIKQKDEEIKKLSEKLLELERHGKTERNFMKSPVSSSDESFTFVEEIKEKLEKETKAADNVTEVKDILDVHEEHTKETNVPLVIETEAISKVVDDPVRRTDEEVIPDLRQKLSDLEDEVKHLQRANVDSLLALQGIQNNTSAYDKSSNDSIINRLLVDHSLLKEELDQLRWDHSKLAQPNLLEEEIKQLKVEVSALRTQNELLEQYVKTSTTQSLNKTSNEIAWRSSLEDLDGKAPEPLRSNQRIFVNNSSSDYIYEKLNSKRRTTSATPNVSTMLKHSIESLESPYHATCQSIKYAVPFNGGETYRARKLSDSSSALIEDIAPKVWMEPLSVNCTPMYYRPTNNYEISRGRQDRQEFDQYSVDSFVSVTASVTETERDDRKFSNTNGIAQQDNTDLLSTADSDTLVDSTDRSDYQRKPKYSYSFTPKAPADLTLDDLVKFARPGGKMSTGRVCFVGHLPGRSEVCVGLELDEDAGKHDGVFECVRYFQCRRNRGVFISFHKIILAYKSV